MVQSGDCDGVGYNPDLALVAVGRRKARPFESHESVCVHRQVSLWRHGLSRRPLFPRLSGPVNVARLDDLRCHKCHEKTERMVKNALLNLGLLSRGNARQPKS